MPKHAYNANRKTTSKRRILAMQFLAFAASPILTSPIFAARPQQNPASISSDVTASENAAASEPADDVTVPSTDDDATSLLDQSLAPMAALPDSSGLDAPSFNLSTGLASSLGATRDSQSAAPAMMGDFFGGSFLFGSGEATTVALAGGDRRYKIAENVSPMPQNRVYFNYNHFHNALQDVAGNQYSLDRFAFGSERAFGDGQFSIDARLPFSSALNSTYDYDNPVPQATELGNLGFGLKALLLKTETWLVSAGTTIVLPTGDDYRERAGGADRLVVKNDAVHMAPYLGLLVTPNQQWFFQGFVQTDFDLNGNELITFGNSQGTIQDQNLMFVDVSMGRWLARRRISSRRTLGIAAISELHYTTTMNNSDFVSGFGNSFAHIDVLNTTLGMHLQYGLAALRIGAAAPLRDGEEKLFDAEVFVQASRAL